MKIKIFYVIVDNFNKNAHYVQHEHTDNYDLIRSQNIHVKTLTT